MGQSAQGAVGELLRRFRLDRGLTQEALAARAGISPRGVQTMESGSHLPFPATLRRVAVALGLAEGECEALALAAQRSRRQTGNTSPRATRAGRVPRRHSTRGQHAVLPQPPTPLVGRAHEVARLTGLLTEGEDRLITLTGPGGVGKTRLALEVAAGARPLFADGVAFVDLTPLTDAGVVLTTIAAALDVVAVGSQPLLTALVEALESTEFLLVLDNCEQVVAAAPEIAALVTGCATLHVLATSRRPLRVRGEHVVTLAPLPVPPAATCADPAAVAAYAAVTLFVRQAQAASPSFALSAESAAAVAALCRQLDGLPLALELAAARVGVLPVRALAERVASEASPTGLSLLSGGARDMPPRHQALRDTIAWSYALLSPREQGLFRGLSIFSGGCTLEAVAQVCGEVAEKGEQGAA